MNRTSYVILQRGVPKEFNLCLHYQNIQFKLSTGGIGTNRRMKLMLDVNSVHSAFPPFIVKTVTSGMQLYLAHVSLYGLVQCAHV